MDSGIQKGSFIEDEDINACQWGISSRLEASCGRDKASRVNSGVGGACKCHLMGIDELTKLLPKERSQHSNDPFVSPSVGRLTSMEDLEGVGRI